MTKSSGGGRASQVLNLCGQTWGIKTIRPVCDVPVLIIPLELRLHREIHIDDGRLDLRAEIITQPSCGNYSLCGLLIYSPLPFISKLRSCIIYAAYRRMGI